MRASYGGRVMLRRLMKHIFARPPAAGESSPVAEAEVQKRMRWALAHARSPLNKHLDIVYGDLRIGGLGVLALSESCLTDSDAMAPPLKAFRRPLASYILARYFLYAMELDGGYAECGVFRGTSALFLCRAALTRRPGYAGEGLHLIDSFEGLSQPSAEDLIANHDASRSGVTQGALSAPVEAARNALREFPRAVIHKGWIPAVFEELPQRSWAFVHIDVDLYEPTLACLEYFYPRLCEKGVVICDDYVTPLFPGAQRAWDLFCSSHGLPFVVLDTGQSVILKS